MPSEHTLFTETLLNLTIKIPRSATISLSGATNLKAPSHTAKVIKRSKKTISKIEINAEHFGGISWKLLHMEATMVCLAP